MKLPFCGDAFMVKSTCFASPSPKPTQSSPDLHFEDVDMSTTAIELSQKAQEMPTEATTLTGDERGRACERTCASAASRRAARAQLRRARCC